jgi:aspartokinase-like uncharacterized kinase
VIDAVVKVGGSLGRGASLPDLCAHLAVVGRRHRLLVVPGGGTFADVVRAEDARFGLLPSTAHWMAILGMDQYGLLLADLTPGVKIVRTLDDAHEHLVDCGVAVLLPSETIRCADALPHSWSVTSDSIAAWLTARVGGSLLVLLKDRYGMAGLASAAASRTGGCITLIEMAGSSGVDGHLATLLRDSRFGVWAIAGEHPERLGELLETGNTRGVRLVRPDP